MSDSTPPRAPVSTTILAVIGLLLSVASGTVSASIASGRAAADLSHAQEQIRELRQEAKEGASTGVARAEQVAVLATEVRGLREEVRSVVAAFERLEGRLYAPTPVTSRRARMAADTP